jgi:hypothetical protein
MNKLTAVMADFAAHQAEHEARVSGQIAELKAALIPLLRASGIARVEVCFDGSGDSGAVEEVLCFDAADNSLACPDLAFALPSHDRHDGAADYAPPTLSAALEQITYLALERHHPGWENNDGAGGQLVIDVGEGSFALGCSLRFIATDDHSTQI